MEVVPGETIEIKHNGFSLSINLLVNLEKVQVATRVVDVACADRHDEVTGIAMIFVTVEGESSFKQDIALHLKTKFCWKTENRGFDLVPEKSGICQYRSKVVDMSFTHKALSPSRIREALSLIESILS
jgi:hypothetical protein